MTTEDPPLKRRPEEEKRNVKALPELPTSALDVKFRRKDSGVPPTPPMHSNRKRPPLAGAGEAIVLEKNNNRVP